MTNPKRAELVKKLISLNAETEQGALQRVPQTRTEFMAMINQCADEILAIIETD
jgi:hypothetical protein